MHNFQLINIDGEELVASLAWQIPVNSGEHAGSQSDRNEQLTS